jgi:hypothetical protein
VPGFHVTNRAPVPGGSETAFLSQDPSAHHRIAMVGGVQPRNTAFVMFDHLAFLTSTFEILRARRARLEAAGVEGLLPHLPRQLGQGKAWAL